MKDREVVHEPRTIGERVRKRRRDLGLSQQEAAARLGVNPWTVINWENGRTEPPVRCLPAVLRFLAYDPFPVPQTAGERLLQLGRQRGWTETEVARNTGVDRATWHDWERGAIILFRKHRALVARLFGLDPAELDREMRARWNGKHRRWEPRRKRQGEELSTRPAQFQRHLYPLPSREGWWAEEARFARQFRSARMTDTSLSLPSECNDPRVGRIR